MANSEYPPVIYHFSHDHVLHFFYRDVKNEEEIAAEEPWFCAGCKEPLFLASCSMQYVYLCNEEQCFYALHLYCATLPTQISHFVDSVHALRLLAAPPYIGQVFNCIACRNIGSGFVYHCGECRLDVHPDCAHMPMYTQNPRHNHALTLFIHAAHCGLGFMCRACGKIGRHRWYYQCKPCGFQLHAECALKQEEDSQMRQKVSQQKAAMPREQGQNRTCEVLTVLAKAVIQLMVPLVKWLLARQQQEGSDDNS